MTVKNLITQLLELPMEAEVCICTLGKGDFEYHTPKGCVQYSETEVGILAEPEKAKLKTYLVDDMEILAESKEDAIKKYESHTNGMVIAINQEGFGYMLPNGEQYWCSVVEKGR